MNVPQTRYEISRLRKQGIAAIVPGCQLSFEEHSPIRSDAWRKARALGDQFDTDVTAREAILDALAHDQKGKRALA
jgi:hypothetical protein